MFIQKLEKFPLDTIIESEYYHLTGRAYSGTSQYALPQLGEIIEETWDSVNQLMRDNDAKAAIMRKEHEIYSLSKKQFLKEVLHGNIKVNREDELNIDEVRYQVNRYLQTRCIAFLDYNGDIWNSPIGSGVW